MVTRQYHGVSSLLLLLVAVSVGVIMIFRVSPVWSLVYLVIGIISGLIIVFSFCSKCPCKSTSCGHVFPGKLTKYLPERDVTPYETTDLLGVAIPVLVLVLFPQLWLIDDLRILGAFWCLILVAVLDISLFVCKDCKNRCCPINKS